MFGIKDVILVLASLLCLIHGLVCLAQQLIRIDIFSLRVIGDADACRDTQLKPFGIHRLRCGSQKAFKNLRTGIMTL